MKTEEPGTVVHASTCETGVKGTIQVQDQPGLPVSSRTAGLHEEGGGRKIKHSKSSLTGLHETLSQK